MEIHLLKSFIAVAEEENLTRAAARLFTSQPAVSAHIKSLEEELGVQLFDRTAKGMILTEDGSKLLGKAEETIEKLEELSELARNIQSNPSGTLKIGINVKGSVLKLESIAVEFSKLLPSISLEFVNGTSKAIQNAIKNGDLDLGFIETPEESPIYTILPIGNASVSVVGSPKFEEEFKSESWEDIQGLPWIFTTPDCSYYRLMERVSKAHNLSINKKYVIEHDVTCRQFVLNGNALTLFSNDTIAEELEEGKFITWKYWIGELTRNLVCLSKRSKERGIETFIKITNQLHNTQ